MKTLSRNISPWLLLAISVLIICNINCFARNLQQVIPESQTEGECKIKLNVTSNYVVMDNGILQMTLANPDGYVVGIRYNGIDNLLEFRNPQNNRGYFDVVWDSPGRCGDSNSIDCTDWVPGTTFKVIRKASGRSEVSFSATWDRDSWNTAAPRAPINVDRRYVMFDGLAGFYSYTILEREPGFPEANIHQIRAVYKLQRDRFDYMAISDERQRAMPMPQDRDTGEALAYKEAVWLTDPVNSDMKGEVDDKYQYACEDHENKVQGWIASNPSVGFWMITPSDEFRSAGPFKQDLTSHTGPVCLQMLHSAHFTGPELALAFKQGEPWKKVFGPFLVYLNANGDTGSLWKDAKERMINETNRWPYDFPLSFDFAKPTHRGSLAGRLLVTERYGKSLMIPAANAWVGLAAPGEPGSWQNEAKGYQFWVTTSNEGDFMIKGVTEGTYSLYATIPGFIGDFKYVKDIQIIARKHVSLGDLVYEPPTCGVTLWEIGFPDRSAEEFFVPDPNPKLVNKLYLHEPQQKFRQYGLWERYTELYPEGDIVYNIGKSDYHKDWFFAHVPRKYGDGYKPTTWQIVFQLAEVESLGSYTLRVAIAAASNAEVQVRFNDPDKLKPDFTTGLIGKDNAIARHGIHGLYWLFSVNAPSSHFRRGCNILYLTQTRCQNPFDGVMYDYIRLEGAPEKNRRILNHVHSSNKQEDHSCSM